MTSGNPCQWQHTRSRIGKVSFKDEHDNVVQLVSTGDHAFNILGTLHYHLSAGHVAGLAVAVVLTDRSTVTAFDLGTSSAATMIGVTEMLKSRIALKPY